MAANWQEWGWTIAAASLSLIGAVLLLWSLFRDRARGRKRCPRCWYDMSGVTSLICPECGKNAKNERRLSRTRRRWRGAALALVLFIGAYGSWIARRVMNHGWIGAVPTWVLIGAFDRDAGYSRADTMRTLESLSKDTMGRVWIKAGVRRNYSVLRELKRRAQEDELTAWEMRFLIRRCTVRHQTNPPMWTTRSIACHDLLYAMGTENVHALGLPPDQTGQLQITVRHRRRWPLGAPLVAEFRPWGPLALGLDDARLAIVDRSSRAEYWKLQWEPRAQFENPEVHDPWELHIDFMNSLDRTAQESGTVTLLGLHQTHSGRLLREWPIDMVIDVVDDPESVVAGVSVPEIDAAMSEIKVVCAPKRGIYLGLNREVAMALFVNPELTLALRVEVLYEGEIVATGAGHWEDHDPSKYFDGDLRTLFAFCRRSGLLPRWPSTVDIENVPNTRADWPPGGGESSKWGGEGWTVRLTGDPLVAVRDIECTKYWKGQVEVPLQPTSDMPPTPKIREQK
jgi:hypothetical protein